MKIGFLSHLDMNLYLFRLPIMQRLREEGHEVYAICPEGDKFEAFKKYGIIPVAYEISRSSLNPMKELKAIYNIYRALKPLDLDMLHTFTAKPNIYGTIAGRWASVPVILNLVEGLGSFYVSDSRKNRMVRGVIEKLYTFVFSQSDGVVFVNSDDPKYLENKGVISKEKIHIIKSVGIDTERFSMDRIDTAETERIKEKLGLKDKVVVLMVARAIWDKGIREFYEAAQMLKKEGKIQFVLVGDIDEGNPSSADAAFLRSGEVLWLGHRDDMVNLTAMCDIYVLPSYREGVPRTLLEAASMARPIVTTDTVGCREVVEDGYNGYLIPVRNVKILSQKIEHLAENPDICEVMGKNGRILAENMFDIHTVVDQYMALYRSLMKQKGIR